MKTRGQVFMPDFIASMVVFGLILTVFLSSWNSVLSDQTNFKKEDEMRATGENTMTFLVTTAGYPENWESDSVDVAIPGFAEPDHVLQPDKLDEFRDLSYVEQRRLLQAENYYMKIENSSGIMTLYGEKLEYGQPIDSAETVVPFTRTVQVNSSGQLKTAEVKYWVWN